jgi:diketogulonate reductase-like aldo/keto reductase
MAYSSFGTQWNTGKTHGRNPVLTNPTLQKIADKHQTTVASVVLSWLIQEQVVAIPRASKPEHIQENALPIVHLGAEKARHFQISEGPALHVILDQDDYLAIKELDGSAGSPWD